MSGTDLSSAISRRATSRRTVRIGPLRMRAFTLFELMVALVVAGLLSALALTSYTRLIDRQKIGAAVRDLAEMSTAIERYRALHFALPMSLDQIGAANRRDPWGNPYQYLNFDADIPGINGVIRKDHNLHPINSEFDLYSMGPDGESRAPLTARASRDDIIYAHDGSFIGPAEDF